MILALAILGCGGLLLLSVALAALNLNKARTAKPPTIHRDTYAPFFTMEERN